MDSIPVKTPKKPRKVEERTVLLLLEGDRVAIEKRPDQGLLASLYQFPNVEGKLGEADVRALLTSWGAGISQVEPAGEAKHIFSHVEWHMTGYRVVLSGLPKESYLFVQKQELTDKYPIPNAFLAYRNVINGES